MATAFEVYILPIIKIFTCTRPMLDATFWLNPIVKLALTSASLVMLGFKVMSSQRRLRLINGGIGGLGICGGGSVAHKGREGQKSDGEEAVEAKN